jgi:hypothetical protein
MHKRVVTLLLFEVAAFAIAALVHGGLPVAGNEHVRAAIAESVIGLVPMYSSRRLQ